MNKAIIYSLAGGLATVLALSLIKKKSVSKKMKVPYEVTAPTAAKLQANMAAIGIKKALTPTQAATLRTYVPAAGDRLTAILARFGYTSKDVTAWQAVNPQNPGLVMRPGMIIKVPPTLKDGGPRAQAQGKVTS